MKKKLSLTEKISLAENNAVDFMHACVTIALHDEYEVGVQRLRKVNLRRDAINEEMLEVMAQPRKSGREQAAAGQAWLVSLLPEGAETEFRVPLGKGAARKQKELQIRMAVDNAATLEEACTAVLKLMGYKMTELNGAFPNAQLNKASEIGLRTGLDRKQGEAMNYEDAAVLLYNALTANTASGGAYGTTLGFTVSNGQVDASTVCRAPLSTARGHRYPLPR